MRLHGRMVDGGHLETLVEHEVSGREARVEVAEGIVHLPQYVAVLVPIVELHGIGSDGLLRIEVRGQVLVLDLDELEGGRGDGVGIRRDGRDLIAHVAHAGVEHALALEDVPVLPVAVEAHVGGVLVCDDRADAGQGLGGARVDGGDVGVGVRGEQDLGVEHAGQLHVIDVLQLARHLEPRIEHRRRLADHPVFLTKGQVI